MTTYKSAEQRAADMDTAAVILQNAAERHGMTAVVSRDVIRIKDGTTTILSLYAPSGYGARCWVDGLFVPYNSGRVVGRSRFATKRSFWRGDSVKAARDAVQYVRRQNALESIHAERDRVLRDRHERPSVHETTASVYLSSSDTATYAKLAYRAGFRTGDTALDETARLACQQDDARLSDSLWYDLLWNAFLPEIRACGVTDAA